MASKVDVCNTALGQLGKPPVTDLTPASLQASGAATQLLRVADQSRDTVLRRHGWLCALSYVQLQAAVIPDDDNWKYAYRFLLPSAALRVWQVLTPADPGVFDGLDRASFDLLGKALADGAWESNTIDTDIGARLVLRANIDGPLPVSYVRTCSWEALDAHVGDAVAFDMASRVAANVLGDLGAKRSFAEEAERRVLMAISVDATQEGGQASLAPSNCALIRAISR